MNSQELTEKLEENLKKFQRNGNNIIPDGIVDIEQYLNSDIKVLWVLKEANSSEDDWDMREALASYLKTEKGLRYGWANTFTPIVYTTNGIFSEENWDNMGDFTKDSDIIDCLQKVAYINVKKIPGGSVADGNVIQNFYNENKEVLHEQIKLINPDVIIFGNTMNFFDENFFAETFGPFEENKTNNHLHIYRNNKHLLLHAHHPNNKTIKHKEYCDFILDAVHQWKQIRND